MRQHIAWPTRHVAYPAWEKKAKPHLVVDTGANHGLGGALWYDDVKRHLQQFGLEPRECEADEVYHGIGDEPLQVQRMAEIPLGLNGMHSAAWFHLLDGEGKHLPGLCSCPDLQRWDGILHMQNLTLELRQLGGSASLIIDNGQLRLPCCEFDASQWDDPDLVRFRSNPSAPEPKRQALLATTHEGLNPSPLIAHLVARGKRGVLKRKQMLPLAEALANLTAAAGQLVDHG